MAAYLAPIPPSAAKSDGIKVGQEAAAAIIAERKSDGADAPRRLSSEGETRRLCADTHYGLLAVAERNTVRHEQLFPIPASAADPAQGRGMGG
jgi:hypothetical protein